MRFHVSFVVVFVRFEFPVIKIRGMKIRKARLSDTSVITDFNCHLALETESLTLNPPVVRRGVRALLADATRGTYFVAESAGAVVGQLLITREWSDWRNGDFWWIQSVYVSPAYRGAGVFSALFRHVEKLAGAKRRVCGLRLYVEQENLRAQGIYDRFGMSLTHYKIYETVFGRR
jgi:ribosomal protein S18 acetylase RimI-like enzyme